MSVNIFVKEFLFISLYFLYVFVTKEGLKYKTNGKRKIKELEDPPPNWPCPEPPNPETRTCAL